jgi:polyphosphate kinase
VHVVYGLAGLKTHCKLAMVVRREEGVARRYVHIGTGNYHPSTARLYTDLGLFTCREDVTADVSDLFNHLTGFGRPQAYRKLWVAPKELRQRLVDEIWRCCLEHDPEQPARMVLKCNGLVDRGVISELYRASQAGVQIDLIVRATCCLLPGVKGLSDNIRVRNIVGRYLEHARVYYFQNDAAPLLYCGSSDWMTRNFFRRVEALFPIYESELRDRILNDILPAELKDNEDARELRPDGTYAAPARKEGEESFSAQKYFMVAAQKRAAEQIEVVS